MKKRGAILSAVFAVLALTALGAVFVNNASPYVSIKEAKTSGGDGLHVAGQIAPNTIQTDLRHSEIRFSLKDETGQVLPVIYTGAPVSNLGSATKVVAIGAMKDGAFVSTQLLVKCPSKYESAPKTKA